MLREAQEWFQNSATSLSYSTTHAAIPASMKAIKVIKEIQAGDKTTDVIQLQEVPTPIPAPGMLFPLYAACLHRVYHTIHESYNRLLPCRPSAGACGAHGDQPLRPGHD